MLTINSEAAIVTLLIKPDKTADFEFVLNKLKEALNKSDKPERREQAAGWKIFKSSQQAQGNAVYIMRIDPVIKGQEYDITRLIAEVFPVEVQEIFAKVRTPSRTRDYRNHAAHEHVAVALRVPRRDSGARGLRHWFCDPSPICFSSCKPPTRRRLNLLQPIRRRPTLRQPRQSRPIPLR